MSVVFSGYCLSSLCLLHQGHVAQKLSASTLHKRAERVAYAMQDKLKLTHGDHVALLYTPSEWRGDHTPWRSASHLPPLIAPHAAFSRGLPNAHTDDECLGVWCLQCCYVIAG